MKNVKPNTLLLMPDQMRGDCLVSRAGRGYRESLAAVGR